MSDFTIPQKPTPSFWKTLFSIMKRFREVRKGWKVILILGVFYVACMSIEPVFSKFIMDSLQAGIQNGMNIPYIAILVIGWFVVTLLIMYARYIYGFILLTKTSDDWAHVMIASIRDMTLLPTKYHISVQGGEKIKLIDRSSEAVWETSDILFRDILPYFLLSCILIVIGFCIHISLTLIALIFLPVSILITRHFGERAHMQQREGDILWDKFFGRISDVFTNIQVVKLSAREEYEMGYMRSLYDNASRKQINIRKHWLRFNSFGQILKIIPRILVLGYSVFLYSRGEISLGTIFFFFTFTDTIYAPIFNILQNYQRLMQSFAKYQQLEETLTLPREVDEGKSVLTGIQNGITFENISFTYPGTEREVLKKIDFTIEKGQRIALVGHTGSGKSTITQLLMRFYEPTEGRILIDGTDIYEFTLESYRQKFSAVFQDTTLFNESIRHNLEYVRDGITEREIESACRQANILGFIESLPEKWETEVGERGLRLSGGEKQRLAIARAILSNPLILILDEATSALDTKTERLVQEAFDRLMIGRTSIVIAHRLSTIQNADMIYLLEHGKIIAWGNHTELMRTSEVYSEMIRLQKDGFVGEEDEEVKDQ